MNSVKLNRKYLFTFFIVLVLLFSFNLNTFASNYNFNISFAEQDFNCLLTEPFTNEIIDDITDEIQVTPNINWLGYTCTRFASPAKYNLDYWKTYVFFIEDFKLFPDYQYIVRGGFCSSFDLAADIEMVSISVLFFENAELVASAVLFEGALEVPTNEWRFLDLSMSVPDVSGVFDAKFYIQYRTGNGSSSGTQKIFLTDFEFMLDDPYSGAVNTPDSGLGNASDDLESAMGELPTLNQDEYNGLFEFDFSSFNNSLSFIRTNFDKIMDISGMGTILTFTLAMGFAIYIIGKKVG